MRLIHGCCLEVLRGMPDNSVDSIVTDPPYGFAFMGKKWDYALPSIEIWREALRVLKPGGHLLAFGGPRTYHRMACGVEDAGFEIRDQLQWLFGSGFPKSLNLKSALEGWGTALKPANEPILLARKPLSEKTVAANVLKWGTGGINIDGCRVGNEVRTAKLIDGGNVIGPKNGIDAPTSRAKNGKTATIEKTYTGRFPANLILDETAAAMLDEQSGVCKSRGEYKKFKPTAKGIFQGGAPVEPNKYANQTGGASRFFYVAKASAREKNEGLEGVPESTVSDGREKSIDNPFQRGETPRKNTHPTIKPIALMRYLCRLITPPNGIVLDPFMGSGSTGVAALAEGFEFIGVEREAEYLEIARARTETTQVLQVAPPAASVAPTSGAQV